jgi:hypothetical protein
MCPDCIDLVIAQHKGWSCVSPQQQAAAGSALDPLTSVRPNG